MQFKTVWAANRAVTAFNFLLPGIYSVSIEDRPQAFASSTVDAVLCRYASSCAVVTAIDPRRASVAARTRGSIRVMARTDSVIAC